MPCLHSISKKDRPLLRKALEWCFLCGRQQLKQEHCDESLMNAYDWAVDVFDIAVRYSTFYYKETHVPHFALVQ